MARSIGDCLPDALYRLLDGTQPEEHVGFTILLATVSEAGWPHLALLSVGEVVAVGPSEVRLALWQASTAVANLSQSGKLTLACVHAGAAYSIRCAATRAGELSVEGTSALTLFKGQVQEVFEDIAPYAILEHGVQYRLTDQASTLERWTRIVSHLRTALL